ncbi:LysR family transcriptional regulator, partial [Burkholderia cenocepacia]|nr:LysR family transcriptional regulator [Burkholderia cenocepacia]
HRAAGRSAAPARARTGTAGLETRINVWIVHGALPGRLMRPVALLRDALGEVLERENGTGSGAVTAD